MYSDSRPHGMSINSPVWLEKVSVDKVQKTGHMAPNNGFAAGMFFKLIRDMVCADDNQHDRMILTG